MSPAAVPEKERWNFAAFKTPAILMAVFWIIAIVLWLTTGKIFYLENFGYIGTALGLGMGIYSALPRRKRWIGRRIAQFLIGVYMLVFLGFVERENMQIEGFFFYLLAGIFAGAVIHYLVAKLVGPLLFNRGWCGWACWTAMLLDLLPFRHNKKAGCRASGAGCVRNCAMNAASASGFARWILTFPLIPGVDCVCFRPNVSCVLNVWMCAIKELWIQLLSGMETNWSCCARGIK